MSPDGSGYVLVSGVIDAQASLPFSLVTRMLRADAARRRSQYSQVPGGA
jgi:hypothetical protein